MTINPAIIKMRERTLKKEQTLKKQLQSSPVYNKLVEIEKERKGMDKSILSMMVENNMESCNVEGYVVSYNTVNVKAYSFNKLCIAKES